MPRRILAVLLCSAVLVGCEGATDPELNVADPQLVDTQESNIRNRNPLLGTWRLKAFLEGEDELVAGTGTSLIQTLRHDGSFLWSVSDDVDYLVCEEPETNCTVSGTYTYTSTTIKFEGVDSEGDNSAFYVLCGGRLIIMDGGADEVGIRLTFVRTRRHCYGRNCT